MEVQTCPVSQAFKDLIETIQESPSHDTADPGDVLKEIQEYVKEFRSRGQHDANELLVFLVDILHEEMKKYRKISIVEQTFSLEMMQVVECDFCKTQSEKSEKYFVLNVPIMRAETGQDQVELEDCLEDFFLS